jgi:2-polyprenyl-3-methyl-5-hydroxy-6-metoxy-1,4-benzoquinol methylase
VPSLDDAIQWEAPVCAACGSAEASTILRVPFTGAPGKETSVVECARCRLRYLTPRPNRETIGHFYQPAYGFYHGRPRSPLKHALWTVLRDAHAGIRVPTWFRPILRSLHTFDVSVPRPRGLRVLDVGCDSGDILLYLRSRGATVLGIDTDAQACELGRRAGLDVRHGTIETQELMNESFDAVIMCHSLEHVHDPASTLAEVARVLRPGGRLHLAVPNGACRAFGAAWEHLRIPHHLYFFAPRSLDQMLTTVGLTLQECDGGEIIRAVATKGAKLTNRRPTD